MNTSLATLAPHSLAVVAAAERAAMLRRLLTLVELVLGVGCPMVLGYLLGRPLHQQRLGAALGAGVGLVVTARHAVALYRPHPADERPTLG